VRLANTEPAVQVEADARQPHSATEHFLAPGAAFDGQPAKPSTGRDGGGLGRFGRVGVIGREARVGECRGRRQLGDQALG
jgi:hypothetical protein